MRGRRLSRILSMIALLRGPTSYNARGLAAFFQTSRRNIYRDVAVLELSGVPIYFDPQFGEHGGYRIKGDFYFPSISLTDQECIDLAMLMQVAESGAVPLLKDASAVRDKLMASLGVRQADTIRQISERCDVLGLNPSLNDRCHETMVTLQQALLKKRQVEGRYFSPGRVKPGRVKLQPHRILLIGSDWYLVAHDFADDESKLFRITQFVDVKLTTKHAEEQLDCHVEDILGNAWQCQRGDRDWKIEIHFTAEVADRVAGIKWHATQTTERMKDGSLMFRATVAGLEEIQWWVLRWGPQAKVLRPKQLKGRVQQLLQETLRQYHDRSENVRRQP